MKQTKQQVIQEEHKEEKQLQEGVREIEEWKNKYMRALADYQNLEKRTNEEKKEMQHYATKVFLTTLLPVVDNLERAETHIQDEGLHIAMKELHALLSKYGVEKMKVLETRFDPYVMECIEVVEGEKDVVVEVISAGYMMHNKLLREAKVKVGGGLTTTV